MKRNTALTVLGVVAALIIPLAAVAQSINEDFTQPTATQSWWFFNGACLTASNAGGSEPSTGSGGSLPGCVTIQPSYYRENLVGGMQLTNTKPDTAGQGALRFTNGSPGGFSQNGGIVSTTPFPTGQGVSITFKTVTYLGNSGGSMVNGNGDDGADGISFFLMDATQLNTSTITGVASGNGNGLGSWGGSLGYTCSNANPPYNGLIGGYIGLGIDEYGNFLNGTSNTLSEPNTSAGGDNTATGGGYQPGRIGLRGAGNVAWNTLNGAYGSNQGSALPYYPSTLTSSCLISGRTYNATAGNCQTCTNGGTYSGAGSGSCLDVCSSGTYSAASGGVCGACAAMGNYTPNYNSTNNSCPTLTSAQCVTAYGNGYSLSGGNCVKAGKPNQPASESPTDGSPSTTGPATSPTDAQYAVQNTCRNATLYNYSNVTNPTGVGATSLTNTANPGNPTATPLPIAPILDYGALPNAYQVLQSGSQIANEGATKRNQATPIFYQLKITQNGNLTLRYATCPPPTPPATTASCGAYQQVIYNYNITNSNGPLPANFLFGFAGSTGGSTNIHEILCFKADPATSAAGSAAASERQSAKLENGIQAYFAYYNPSNGWNGRVTASSLAYDTYGNITISPTPNWDASCVLTGGTCSTTGQTGLSAQPMASRNILSWNDTPGHATGIAFAYNSLSSNQQTNIDLGDSTATPPATALSSQSCYPYPLGSPSVAYVNTARVAYLSGDRTCEVNSLGQGIFRRRTSLLGDVMDSSPVWVGSPDAPYSAVWTDRINAQDPLSENAATAPTYPAFVTANQSRTQVVYVGSNDGLVHGFRSGYFNIANAVCTGANPPASCFTNNDGQELLAYMPGAVVNGIHQWAASTGANPNPAATAAAADFSNPQYGHSFYVNATPYAGDLFYGNQWHTWLVGGLGDGGAAIYALDITNPGSTTTTGSSWINSNNTDTSEQFVVGSAANPSLVMGEWTPSSITCSGNPTCGLSLGNTFGTPQIRRLHDGNWGVIFGNGFSSCTGDAGIYVGVVNPVSAALTFYYIRATAGAGSAGSCLTSGGNGIAYVTPADLDGDHITDYVYAGDLNGNVWRFDLTSANESTWTSTAPYKVFTTQAGQPITTQISVASGPPSPGLTPQLMLIFGTGQKVELSNSTGSTYATAQQTLYGVWDWNLSAWNSMSTNTQYSAQPPGTVGTLAQGNLTPQVANTTCNATTNVCGDVEIQTNATVCWYGLSFCASNNTSFGWYLNLPNTNEQVIYNPELVAQAITVNTVVPAQNTPTSCSNNNDTGYTYVLNAMNGNAFYQVFLPPAQVNNPLVNSTTAYTDTKAIAMQTNATGSSFVTTNATGVSYLIYETNTSETVNGNILQGGSLGLNLPPNTTGRRLSWVELR